MNSLLNKQIGKQIQYLRKQKGFSQEKLAEILGIAPASLSYIETGRGFMTLSTIEKLSKILSIEPYEIFQFTSVNSNDEMYKFLTKKLESIRENNEKLRLVFNILKSIL